MIIISDRVRKTHTNSTHSLAVIHLNLVRNYSIIAALCKKGVFKKHTRRMTISSVGMQTTFGRLLIINITLIGEGRRGGGLYFVTDAVSPLAATSRPPRAFQLIAHCGDPAVTLRSSLSQ